MTARLPTRTSFVRRGAGVLLGLLLSGCGAGAAPTVSPAVPGLSRLQAQDVSLSAPTGTARHSVSDAEHAAILAAGPPDPVRDRLAPTFRAVATILGATRSAWVVQFLLPRLESPTEAAIDTPATGPAPACGGDPPFCGAPSLVLRGTDDPRRYFVIVDDRTGTAIAEGPGNWQRP